jgi:hypothetical protein
MLAYIFLDFTNQNGSIPKAIPKQNFNKDDLEYILSGNKAHNNIYIAKEKHSYTKYGQLMESTSEK